MNGSGFGWLGIFRLGLVQAAIGAIVMLATSLLNRVMVVEYSLVASIPAGLVAWHYAVQLLRPVWGHGSDRAPRRSPWILGGVAILGLGSLIAVAATNLVETMPTLAMLAGILGYTLVGAGVGAGGTSLLALLAAGVAPQRRAGAAAATWIMMVMGIVISAGVAGAMLDPFSAQRLLMVAAGVVAGAFAIAAAALFRLEPATMPVFEPDTSQHQSDATLREALRDIFEDREARRLTAFIFVSMLAYSMQDLILEPFAGLIFGMTPGQSTALSGIQHGGVLLGMITAGVGGSAFALRGHRSMRGWIVAGCLASAIALALLATGGGYSQSWPLTANVFLLGLGNGIFAVSAIGAMMALAGSGRRSRQGARMGVWGAAQAIAFGLGGLIGAVGVDLARRAQTQDAQAFQMVFVVEAMLFVASAALALKVPTVPRTQREALA